MSNRINHQPIFLLSSSPWRENSLRLEVFSRDHGRLSLLARSARTRGSELRGILIPFIPLSASWYGKEELKTLHRAEWIGGWQQPKNQALLTALYLNELLLKLTPREDPAPQLFAQFQQCQQHIAQQTQATIALRHFEWQLLTALGQAPSHQHDHQQNPIQAHQHYRIRPEYPAEITTPEQITPNSIIVSGSLLQALGNNTLTPQHNLHQALQLNRLLLNHQLPQGIKSRQIQQQLQQLKHKFQAA